MPRGEKRNAKKTRLNQTKIKDGPQICMTFKISMKSHSSPACDNLYLYAKKDTREFGDLLI